METIKKYIKKKVIEVYEYRIKRFKEINAPEIIQLNLKRLLKELKNGGEVDIKGDIEYLDFEFVTEEIKVGRGGKEYSQFTLKSGEKVNYFPSARYGRYIKKEN